MAEREGLKPLDQLTEPDIRHSFFVRIDQNNGATSEITLESHYADIEQYPLNDEVPEDIAIQYDVSRNLYAYAWFQYRFFNVAEAHLFTVLELAMRSRIGEKELKTYMRDREKKNFESTGTKLRLSRGIKTMIEYCRDHELVKNENFTAWHQRNAVKARINSMVSAVRKMEEMGLSSLEFDPDEFKLPPPDQRYDHIQKIDHANRIRNEYAHGTTMLHRNVLHRFVEVSEFINQLYAGPSQWPTKDCKASPSGKMEHQ